MQIFFDKRLWTDQGLFGEDYVLTIVIAATTSVQLIITSLTYFVSANKNAVLLWWPLIDDIRVVVIRLWRLLWLYDKEKRIRPATLFI
ncbi:hypothetical protein MHBO_001133 [Bonamia ostreae]|uniref:Uncharacterized protein n=1 Tax=Bonamia ostreae TaxID=126728 RepID=A0ABV2AIK5_9EUKA